MADLSDVITTLATETVSVARPAASSYNSDGILVVGGTASTFSAAAVVVPATGKDLQRLPEGFNTREVVALLTAAELRTASDVAGTRADVVTLTEGTYEVFHVENWKRSGNFYRSLAMKVEAP